MINTLEIWLPIPGFEGKYEISDLGNLRSLDRVMVHKNRWGNDQEFQWKGRVMKPVLHHTGYLITKLGHCSKMFRYHQLVAWAFNGSQPAGTVINHIDGNKLNNTPSNLEYISNSENVKHAYRTGLLSNCGSTNGKAVLNDEIVRKIRSFPLTVSAGEVASALGLKKHNVHQVRSGRSWSHVGESK